MNKAGVKVGRGLGPSKTKVKQTASDSKILVVQILEAKPNAMFAEEQRAAIRFLRFNQWVRCQECGRRKKVMWTMVCEFYAHSMGQLTVEKSMKIHKPLDEVCQDHLLAPAWPEEKEPKKGV